MAVSPRSFLFSPVLLLATLILGTLPILFVATAPFPLDVLSYWQAIRSDCQTVEDEPVLWTEEVWGEHVQCFLAQKRYPEAYASADRAVVYHPKSELLLNLKGYSAARAHAFGLAALDFQTGLRRTGSPSGVFENNLAWVGLHQSETVPFPRRGTALTEAGRHYRAALAKRVTCEGLHTAMFVEFATATHHADEQRLVEAAITRYDDLHSAYRPCWARIGAGREEVVEEVMSAALLQTMMQEMRGADDLSDAKVFWDQAVEAGASREMCEHVPIASVRARCSARLR